MGFGDVLKDYQPTENEDDSGFKPFKGTYKSIVSRLALDVHEQYGERYELELTVTETLDGDEAVGRKLWRRYAKEDEAAKKLLNDLFTAGIEVPRATEEEFNNNLDKALDKEVTIRTWAWTPDKTVSGEPIAEDERVPRQQFKIVSGKKVKGGKKASGVPF